MMSLHTVGDHNCIDCLAPSLLPPPPMSFHIHRWATTIVSSLAPSLLPLPPPMSFHIHRWATTIVSIVPPPSPLLPPPLPSSPNRGRGARSRGDIGCCPRPDNACQTLGHSSYPMCFHNIHRWATTIVSSLAPSLLPPPSSFLLPSFLRYPSTSTGRGRPQWPNCH